MPREPSALPDATSLGFRPADIDFITNPYPVFEQLRRAGRALAYPERGVTLLTRFEDVNTALRDRRLGRDYRHKFTDEEFGRPDPDPRWARWAESERWSLLNLEPPDHTRLRRLITKVFTAKSVAALRPRLAEIAAAQLEQALQGNTFDLISQYAQPFSVAVICTLLGVPLADGPKLLDWSHAIVKMYEFSTSDEDRLRAERAVDEFVEHVRTLIAARRVTPEDDLITELVQVSDSGDRLTEDEIVSTVIVLLNAGHEATVNTLGNGMRAMMLHPDQWQRITSGEVAPATAVEEMIRWDAPLQLFERWVLADGVELAGCRFNTGDRIAMMFGSANRDADRFPAAAAFDAGRGDSTHIGFGGGLHFCIGAPLARLELEVSVSLLRQQVLSLAETPTYQPFFVIRGLDALRLEHTCVQVRAGDRR